MNTKGSCFHRRAAGRGFTLLEMCMVLFVIALMAGAAMPALQSAFNERALRNDTHDFSILVKTAMLRSSEEKRSYVLSLKGRELRLTPTAVEPGDDVSADESDTQTLDNTLKLPEADEKNVWRSLPAVTWIFQPDSLCPLPRVRFERGGGNIEMSFNALTGDVEDEGYDLP